jgi:hypothetical protein
MSTSRSTLVRAVPLLWFVLAMGAVVTIATWVTGGFRTSAYGLRISSSSAIRPLAIAAMAGLLLARDPQQRLALVRMLRHGLLPVSLIGCAAFAWTHAAPVAAAADMFGYISQATDWWRGTLVHTDWIDQRYFPAAASVPLGYLYRNDGVAMAVALYPPGTSLHMALFALVGDWAMYLVSPLAALAVVLGTYALGRACFDDDTALAGAAIVACNPVLLVQASVPMSDTLAAAYWTWSLALATSARPALQVVAGALAGLAIGVRPNLAPLIVGPVGCATWSAGMRGALVVSAAASPFAALLAWHNVRLYGSAASTGYGPTTGLFSVSHMPVNVQRYGTWLWQTMSPLPLAGFAVGAAQVAIRLRMALLPLVLFVLANVGIYLVYLPWPNWTFARFLLPAIPVIVLVAVCTARHATARAPAGFAVLVLVVVGWQMDYAQRSELRTAHEALLRFKELPERLRRDGLIDRPIITRMHSGSLRHYGGITASRWDVLSPEELRRGITSAIADGHRPLLVDDSDDRTDFEQRFGPLSCWTAAAAPLVTIERHATVRVFAASPGCAAP